MSRILLIETDRLLANAVSEFLTSRGHDIDWQADPQEALSSADRVKPDAVILDLILAAHNGIEFLYEFRSYPDWAGIPIIIFSNLTPPELANLASGLNQLDIADCHYKPATSLDQLSQSIERALRRQPIHEAL